MKFILIKNKNTITNIKNTACLIIDEWDDFGFKTTFSLTIVDSKGLPYPIGSLKIGYKDQKDGYTSEKLENIFDKLPNDFFSLGLDIDFYTNLWKLPKEIDKRSLLINLNDIAYNSDLFNENYKERVMKKSLLRGISEVTIREQFKRVFEDKSPLTDFNFFFIREESEHIGGLNLEFNIIANSTPSTNIHAIIGRNGAGKTTLLNDMVNAFNNGESISKYGFYHRNNMHFIGGNEYNRARKDIFSHLIAVSFSVFDPFIPNNKELYKNYYYIGLKETEVKLKNYLRKDFLEAFLICKSQYSKKLRWINAIKNLESDDNFYSMNLASLINEELDNEDIMSRVKRMSSGHSSVLLIITQLVAKVEEKTLVLLDEPESHLHPPLLSAFIRALSDLLDNRNGVAIIATHSPVVLQEIPKSCVWKIERTGVVTQGFRLEIETFGENVGVLTREVFGLESTKSGFYNLLNTAVNSKEMKNKTYDEIALDYGEQLGSEARIFLKTLIYQRDNKYN